MNSHQRVTRRRFIASAIAAHGVAAFGLAQRRSQPNIVFILADDLGYADTSSYGQKKFRTPHIDRLASGGVTFTNAYAGAPVCSPSRCSLLTGLHTGHTRIRDNFALAAGHVGHKGNEEIRRASLLATDRTVAEHLKSSGYRTGLVGKWHLDGYDSTATPNRHGFDEFRGWLTQTASTQGYYPTQRYRNDQLISIPENEGGQKGRYETDIVTADAREFIGNNRTHPFFLYVAYSAPHSPYVAPDQGSYHAESWDDDEKTYAAMIERLDNGIGSILQALNEAAIENETVVFFASDNGPRSEPTAQQTKVVNFFDSNGPLRGYKRDMFEGGIRDPLIVRWPGHVPAASRCDVPTYFPDFLPTALDLAGAPSAKTDGLSLKPFLLHPGRRPVDRYLYWEFYEPEFMQAALHGRWKAVRLRRSSRLELYDLQTDPGEVHNIAAQYPEVVGDFERYMSSSHQSSPEYPDPVAKE